MIKKFNYFFQALLIYLIFLIGRILGIKISRKLFSHIFFLIGPIFKSKDIITSNIKIFSKNLSESESKGIIDNMWRNYGMTFIEYIFLDYFRKNNNHMKITGLNNISEQIEGGKPVIFVSGHFGNFELMAMQLEKLGIHLSAIYRPLNNIFLNKVMERIRKKYICKNQIKKGIGGIKKLIELQKKNYSTALMIDQRVSEGIYSNFFNQKALTTTIPAQLVKKFNMPIVPIYIERINNINFKMTISKPINFPEGATTGDITDRLNHILEKMVIHRPEQWIWSHNRWK